MIKLVYQGKNKIIKHQGKSFEELRQIISTHLPEVPIDYSLSYLDEDKDEICLNSNEDLVNMLNHQVKLHKVYIKQSLSQTIVLDLDQSSVLEPSFSGLVNSSKVQESKHFQKKNVFQEVKVEEVKAEEVKVEEVNVEEPEEVQRFFEKPEPAAQVQVEVIEISADVIEIKKEERKEENLGGEKIVDEKKKEVELFQSEILDISQEIVRQKIEVSEVIEIIDPKSGIKSETLIFSDDKRVHSKVIASEQVGSPKIEKPANEDYKHIKRAKIFENPYELKEEILKESSINAGELFVHKIMCSYCNDEFGILGIRYQCILCNDFNLCSNCEEILEHQHALVKVKKPEMAITKENIIQKYKKELAPQENRFIPPGHYVPSVSHDEAKKLIETAKVAYEQGMNRNKNLMEELFYKMSMSHKNPLEGMKQVPKPPKKVETVYQKTKYMQEVLGLEYNDAFRFASQYPHHNSEQIVEMYFKRDH